MMLDTEKVLAAIGEVRDESRARGKETVERLERIESEAAKMRAQVVETQARVAEVADQTNRNTKLIGDQAEAITRVANAAAKAADIGLDAKREFSEATKTTTTIVEAALRIHNSSVGASVDDAVKRRIEPVFTKVDVLESNDKAQAESLKRQDDVLAKQDEKLDALVSSAKTVADAANKAFRHPVLRVMVAVAVAVGITLGSTIAGYVIAKQQLTESRGHP